MGAPSKFCVKSWQYLRQPRRNPQNLLIGSRVNSISTNRSTSRSFLPVFTSTNSMQTRSISSSFTGITQPNTGIIWSTPIGSTCKSWSASTRKASTSLYRPRGSTWRGTCIDRSLLDRNGFRRRKPCPPTQSLQRQPRQVLGHPEWRRRAAPSIRSPQPPEI